MARPLDMIRSHARPAARRAVLAALAGLIALAPTAAWATTFYVGPGGSDSNTGLTSGARWATIGKANSALRAGDAVLILPGSYGQQISPVNAGTPTQRISYIGDMANPGAVVVTGLQVNTPYVTVKGIHTTNTGTINYPARNDSIVFCQIEGGQVFYGAKYCMVAHNAINGGISFALDQAGVLSGISNCERDTLRGNAITQNPIGDTHGFKLRGFTQYCLIDSNRVDAWFDTASGQSVGIYTYDAYYITFRDNHWTYEARVPYQTGPWKGIAFRDSSHDFVFVRDTLLLGLNSGSNGIAGALSTSGTFGQVRNMTWDSCVYMTNTYFYNEDPIVGDQMRNSVFASSGPEVFNFAEAVQSLVMDHCTLYGAHQVTRIDPVFGSGPNVFTSNVMYSQAANPLGGQGGIVKYGGTGGLTSNNNVYFTPTYTSSPGDRSITWCCYTGSKPGTGTPWNSASGQDGASIYSSPMFTDSTFAGLDVHLRLGSPAIGRGAGGTDAGAYPFVAAGPDLTPPGPVSNLATSMVSDQVAMLTWTAPGDNGVIGLASGYDLRWSTQPITSANFGSATPVSPQPIPLVGGSLQSYAMLGLTPGTTYYFAIKAVDEANNWSSLSNVLTVATTASDQQAPKAVTDLGASP
jgi:hypothetical protein